jgi:hypothetical protein
LALVGSGGLPLRRFPFFVRLWAEFRFVHAKKVQEAGFEASKSYDLGQPFVFTLGLKAVLWYGVPASAGQVLVISNPQDKSAAIAL